MNVRNFFQLQSAFKCNRIFNITADVDEVFVFVELLRKQPATIVCGKGLLNIRRQVHELLNGEFNRRIAKASYPRDMGRKEEQRGKLRCETLGGGYRDLLAGMCEKSTVGILCQRRFRNITNSKCSGAFAPCRLQSRNRVNGCA